MPPRTIIYVTYRIGDAVKNVSYSVTFSLKMGGGQEEIILLEDAKILTL